MLGAQPGCELPEAVPCAGEVPRLLEAPDADPWRCWGVPGPEAAGERPLSDILGAVKEKEIRQSRDNGD